jgi:hypothetical protein
MQQLIQAYILLELHFSHSMLSQIHFVDSVPRVSQGCLGPTGNVVGLLPQRLLEPPGLAVHVEVHGGEPGGRQPVLEEVIELGSVNFVDLFRPEF